MPLKQLLFKVLLSIALFGVFAAFFYTPPASVRKEFRGIKHTIPYRIVVLGSSETLNEAVIQQKIETVFLTIDTIFNRWNPNSELSQLNQAPENEKIPLSDTLDSFLHFTEEVVLLTHSRFDPTVFPLHTLWKTYLENGETPPKEIRKKIEEKIGWDKIELGDHYLVKKVDGVEIDLDGLVKGHAVDLLATSLDALNPQGIFIEWGGEIAVRGTPEKNRPWKVVVSSLDPKNAPVLELKNQAIATSGDAYQSWATDNGKTYTHILNPYTKKPLEVTFQTPFSATVIAPQCALADALATTLMQFSDLEEAKQFTNEIAVTLPAIEIFMLHRKEKSKY